MTSEQKAFLEAIEAECKGGIVAIGCAGPECEYADGDEEHQCDEHFSWSTCDGCGSTLGGSRLPAHWISTETDEFFPIEVCVDCALFHANGDLPERWSQYP